MFNEMVDMLHKSFQYKPRHIKHFGLDRLDASRDGSYNPAVRIQRDFYRKHMWKQNKLARLRYEDKDMIDEDGDNNIKD